MVEGIVPDRFVFDIARLRKVVTRPSSVGKVPLSVGSVSNLLQLKENSGKKRERERERERKRELEKRENEM
jgi:hypothetical protein